MIGQSPPSKTIISLFLELFTLSQSNHKRSARKAERVATVSNSSSTSSSSIDWAEVSKTLEPSTHSTDEGVFVEPFEPFLVSGLEESGDQPEEKMIMEGLDSMAQVALSEPQHYSLSFDSYKPLSDSDDNPSPARSVIDSFINEPATAGERTPGSPGSATGTGDNTNVSAVDDSLNTPVSTSSDLPVFFSIVTSIPDAVPITGRIRISVSFHSLFQSLAIALALTRVLFVF